MEPVVRRPGVPGRSTLVARDPTGVPGRHSVRATSGAITRAVTYDATS